MAENNPGDGSELISTVSRECGKWVLSNNVDDLMIGLQKKRVAENGLPNCNSRCQVAIHIAKLQFALPGCNADRRIAISWLPNCQLQRS